MTGFLDNAEVDISCPKCGRKSKQRIGRLKNNPLIKCICGTEIQIKADGPSGLSQGVKSVDKSLDDLRRAFGKLGK